MAPRASLPLVMALAVALAPTVQGQAPPPCADLSGAYLHSLYGEWAIYQTGCSFIAADMLNSNITGNVSGNAVTFNYTGKLSLQGLIGYWNPDTKVISLNDGSGSTLTKTGNCSDRFVGYWVDGSNASLAISVDTARCTGLIFRSPGFYSANLVLSGHVLTYRPSATATTNVTAVLTLPGTLTFDNGTVWRVGGPTPCFRKSDFRLNAYCWSGLQGLQIGGVYGSISQAVAGREQLWNLNSAACSSYGSPQSTCPASCKWVGACICPDEATCVASGFLWQTSALLAGVCTGNIPALLMQPTLDCCGGAPNICQAIGTASPSPSLAPIPSPAYLPPTPGPSYWPPTPTPGPNYYPPAPAYYPPAAGCGKVPSSAIQKVEQNTGLVVRRCGSSPPSPAYAPTPGYWPPTPPPPYYGPSPGYWPPAPPSPYYGPAPAYWMPTTPPAWPSPSPSYPKTPSPSWR